MLDPKILREALSEVSAKLATRGFNFPVEEYDALENSRKSLQVQVQTQQNERNVLSKEIGKAKGRGENCAEAMAKVKALGESMGKHEKSLAELLDRQQHLLAGVPNLPHSSVPLGKDEADNRCEKEVPGSAERTGDRDHVDILDSGLNTELAAQLTGSRFSILHGNVAKLHRALTQFMLDLHTTEHGYQEQYVPYIVSDQCLYGTGQLPKFKEDLFHINAEREWYLIPTAEVPLTNLVRESIIDIASLPLKFTAHTPCFRSEAGSYGKDTRGMFRQHQFDKVELVQIVAPEQSYNALEELTGHAEAVLEKLGLPYRRLTLCTGDMGFGVTKTYDLEVWLPGQNQYREISSCSNCEDFQARRLHARFRSPEHKKPQLLHTLNGSGVAVGRCLIAIVENYQQVGNTIAVPEVLQPYMAGVKQLDLTA